LDDIDPIMNLHAAMKKEFLKRLKNYIFISTFGDIILINELLFKIYVKDVQICLKGSSLIYYTS
jgi:hypothetical protein